MLPCFGLEESWGKKLKFSNCILFAGQVGTWGCGPQNSESTGGGVLEFKCWRVGAADGSGLWGQGLRASSLAGYCTATYLFTTLCTLVACRVVMKLAKAGLGFK